jgi:mannose-6-phosphate isomerase-like protein (cupin superfamily)
MTVKTTFVMKNEMKTVKAGGTSIRSLQLDAEDQSIESFVITQAPHTDGELPAFGEGPFVHEGEEHHLVLKGSIVETYDGREFKLEEGDYFYFQGLKPHSWRNTGEQETRMFVFYAPRLTAHVHYFDHLNSKDRDVAYQRMRDFGISPPDKVLSPDLRKITKSPFVVRKREFKSETVAKTIIEFPTPNVKDQVAELCTQTTGPKARFEYLDGRGPFRHEGEELLYSLSGTLKMRVGTESRNMTEGDLVYFSGLFPHEFENAGDTPMKCILVESPPITVRPDYYDHLSGADREYALQCMKKYGMTPPASMKS